MLRRTKREVEKELPSKTEHVVKCAMSAWQKILYQQITDKASCLLPPLSLLLLAARLFLLLLLLVCLAKSRKPCLA